MAHNPKKRECPALGKTIKRNDCGENRISRYDCPETCEFNPFTPANYSDLLETEEQLDDRMVARLKREPKLASNIDRELKRAATHPQPDLLIHDTFTRNIYFTPLEDGRTLAQTFLEDEPKLKNDARILLRSKQEARVALLEVRDVIDGQRLRVIDLLRPGTEPLVICDRSWAKRAVRYDTGITWCYSLPHFDRLGGVLSEWMDFGLDPVTVLLKITVQNGGPSELGQSLNNWLLLNMELVNGVMHDAAYERQRLIYESMDAMQCRAAYDGTADSEMLIGRLTMEPDTDDGDIDDKERAQGFVRAWDWFQGEDSRGHHMFGKEARILMGRVLLNKKGDWRLESFGEAKYVALKQAFEARMEGGVALSSERKDNIAAKALGDHKPLSADKLERIPADLLETLPELDFSQSRIPVNTEEETLSMVQMRERQLRSWIDESIPKLDGASPREASLDPSKRPELLRLVKGMIRSLDRDALEAGEVADVDWLYEALGLDDIQAAAPPQREVHHAKNFEGPALNRPVLPPVPARELTDMDEVFEIEDRVFELLDSGETESIITPNGFAVLAVLREVVVDDDSDEAIERTADFAQYIMPLILMLLGTSEVFEVDLSLGELRAEVESQITGLLRGMREADDTGERSLLSAWVESSRQPLFLRLMMGRLKEYQEDMPGSFDENAEVPASMALCCAAALINLLCQKLDRVPR